MSNTLLHILKRKIAESLWLGYSLEQKPLSEKMQKLIKDDNQLAGVKSINAAVTEALTDILKEYEDSTRNEFQIKLKDEN